MTKTRTSIKWNNGNYNHIQSRIRTRAVAAATELVFLTVRCDAAFTKKISKNLENIHLFVAANIVLTSLNKLCLFWLFLFFTCVLCIFDHNNFIFIFASICIYFFVLCCSWPKSLATFIRIFSAITLRTKLRWFNFLRQIEKMCFLTFA